MKYFQLTAFTLLSAVLFHVGESASGCNCTEDLMVQSLLEDIADQRQALEELEIRAEDCADTIPFIDDMLVMLDEDKKKIEDEVADASSVRSDTELVLKRQVEAVKAQLDEIEKENRCDPIVSAKLNGVMSSPGTVSFDEAPINFGGAYNIATGLFTAAQDGLYLVMVYMLAEPDSEVHIMVNSSPSAKVNSLMSTQKQHDLVLGSSNLIKLTTGDEVSVKLTKGELRGNGGTEESSFSVTLMGAAE